MRIAAALLTIALCGTAHAQLSPFFAGGVQSIAKCDFRSNATAGTATNTTVVGPRCPPLLTNRTTIKNDYSLATGAYKSFAIDTPAIGIGDPVTGNALGLGIEGSSTIVNKFSRDLTNAAWTKVNATAALSQTGIFGDANSASLLTATGANATACIAAGGTANQRVLSTFMQRKNGSGEVDVSPDGVNWTPVTTSLSASILRRVPSNGLYNTIASAQVCFRLVTSGDQVAIDEAQNEADSNRAYVAPTTPVTTASSANVVRAADNIWMDLSKVSGWNDRSWTIAVKYMLQQWIVPGGDNSNLRRAIFQIEDGTGITALFANNQTDGFNNLLCAPDSGNPLHCQDFNLDGRVAFTPWSAGKVRASIFSGASTLAGLAPPGVGQFAAIAVSYDANTGTCISVNTGGPPTTLSNGQYFQSGVTQPVCSPSVSPSVPLGVLKRLVLGSAPDEASVIGGTPVAGDAPQLTATWEAPQGTTNTESVSYTVLNGDSTTAVAAGLAAAINADATLAASGITATNSGANVLPAHGPAMFVTWSKANSGGTTIAQSNNTGSLYGYMQTLEIWPTAFKGGELMQAVPNTSPGSAPLIYIADENGLVLADENGSLLQQ